MSQILSSARLISKKFQSEIWQLQRRNCAATVYALSSGFGKCGVAVVRVTGPHSSDVLKRATAPGTLPPPRKAVLRRVLHPVTGECLDRGLILWLPGPKSFTGEDSCELQVHGGSAVVAAVLDALGTIPNLRPARPGDFTRRAFRNGKLDLTGVEGLADLIHAETEHQRRQALRQLDGALSSIYSNWRQQLLQCRAGIEALIDFSEEENIESGVAQDVEKILEVVASEMTAHLSDGRRGERLRSGVKLAILGKPNVGKSSLLNALCRRPAAIVSPIAGTTRDVLEAPIDIAGYPVLLSDTAGLRHSTSDVIEKEGVKRALAGGRSAHLVLLVIEATEVLRTIKRESKTDMMSPMMQNSDEQLSNVTFGSGNSATACTIERKNNVETSSCGAFEHDSFVRDYCREIGLFDDKQTLTVNVGDNLGESITKGDDLSGVGSSNISGVLKNEEEYSDYRDFEDIFQQSLKSDNSPRLEWLARSHYLVLVNKIDQIKDPDDLELLRSSISDSQTPKRNNFILMSLLTEEGFDTFIDSLVERLSGLCASTSSEETPALTNSRHRQHIKACLRAINNILHGDPSSEYLSQEGSNFDDLRSIDEHYDGPNSGNDKRLYEPNKIHSSMLRRDDLLPFAAQDLAIATTELGRISGEVSTEHVLSQIFSTFCIGK